MIHKRWKFRPDLADAVLEDRTLAAYDPSLPPLVLTTGGYAAFAVPLTLSANLGALNGPAIGGNGGTVGTGFFLYGFGASVIGIGSPVGIALGGARASAMVSLNTVVGSGVNDTQGPQPVTRSAVAQGGGAAALPTPYIRPQATTGGYVPGAELWEQAGESGPFPPAQPPPPVPPAPPPTPAPVSQAP